VAYWRSKPLRNLVKGQDVTCKGDTRDRYKRLIAVCYVVKINLNAMMVANGWALAYRKYSKDYAYNATPYGGGAD
jgi:endonuclease YncB( thermonuclease family)